MSTRTYSGQLVVQECINCGVPFGVPKFFDERRLSDKETFYCPNGHPQNYVGKTDRQLAREAEKRAAELERRSSFWEEEARLARNMRDSALNRERAQKAAKTRLKNRIAKGVCPCCNRHFTNVERHIKNQHPDFVADNAKTSEDGGS